MSIPRHAEVTLPDFCNLGVTLRVLLLSNALLAFFALAKSRPLDVDALTLNFLGAAAFVEPVLIASLALLCPLRGPLRRAGYQSGVLCIVALELMLTAGFRMLIGGRGATFDWPLAMHDWIVAVICTMLILYYFNLRERAFSPALSEARLQALQARIRPHFLFNSLTAVLSLIRTEPRRAETALEDLADLFRVLLRERRNLVPLAEEVDLCRRYLAIETLRLGDRLNVEWQVDDAAANAAIPPLILQPLVENAVHHGIEPSALPGTVRIAINRRGKQLEIVIVNPRVDGNTRPVGYDGVERVGNHMAVENVRERLALNFDVEARLETSAELGQYRVRIVVPHRPATGAAG